MADEEYVNRIRDLQRYIPFLEHTIKRLKSETGKVREAQILKLQSLLEILTDTKKKLKYDALRKCEEVILKLYEKVEKKPPSETMHKYMCRNPPDDKFPFSSHDSSSNLDSEVAFSVARQKLSKQADLTPTSPSPPLENTLSARPIVIPTEKVRNDRRDIFSDHNEFSNAAPPYCENWSAKQTLNWPASVFNPHFPMDKQIRPSFLPQNSNWNKEQQLYFRRSEISPRQELKNPKFNVWCSKESNITKDLASRRELIDYSDTFEVGSSPILEDPKPVPAPRIIAKQDRIVREYLEEQKKIQLLKSPTPPKLNKPPLSKSDLQDLLSCTPSSSDGSPPLVNEDMDLEKLEELKEKLYRELEKSKEKEELKVSKPSPVLAPKPKPIIMEQLERVVKEQDNIYGNLLSSIDQQIMGKKEQKKVEKKDVNTSKNIKKDEKSDTNKKDIKPNDKKYDKVVNKTDIKEKKEDSKHITKDSKHKEHDKSKGESKARNKDANIKDGSKNKDKDLKNKDKESKSKDLSKEKQLKHKDRKENDSKKDDTKSKEEEHSSSSKNKEKSSDTTKVDKSRRTSLTKEEKQKTDKPQTVDTKSLDASTIPNINIPLVDKIMKELKESIKEKKVDLPEKLVKNDDKTSATGRLSDKYPHKRKPSIDKLDPIKPEPPKDTPLKVTSPKKPLTTEVHSTKLQDPRLRTAFPPVPPVELKSPPFTQNHTNNFQNEPIVKKPPSIGPFSLLPAPFLGNRTPKDPFANNMGNINPNDPFAGNMTPMDPFAGNMTPTDPFSTNYDVDMRQLPFQTNFNNQNDQFRPPEPFRPNQDHLRPQMDQIRPEMDQYRPAMAQFRPGMDQLRPNQDKFRPNQDQFHQNPEPFRNNPDMFRQNPDQFRPRPDQFKPNQDQFRPNQEQFRGNQDQIRPGPNQFRSNPDHFRPNQDNFQHKQPDHFRHKQPDHFRPNPGKFRRHTDEFRSNEDQFRPTFNPRFPNQNAPSRNRADIHQNQSQEQNFNPYDLSQMNPIDFYENEDQDKERTSFYENEKLDERRDDFSNRRSFRGRGKRGNYCPTRGHFRNVQWVNPMIRDEGRREDPKDERRKPSNRFPNKNDREDKDPRRSRSSEEKNDQRSSRFEERNDSEEKRPPPNEAKREDPRKKKPEEIIEDKPKIESAELSSVKPKEEISSPLDMLYSSVTKPIVGKGYGFQNFRIPKIRKSEIKEEKKEEVKNENEENMCVEDESKVEEIIEEPKEEEEDKMDDAKNEEQNEKTNASDSTSKKVIENPKTEADEKLDMFNKFMKHIFDTCDSSFLLQYLDKCGISMPQSKTKRIRRIIDSESEEEEQEIKREAEITREEQNKEKVEEVKVEETSPPKEPEPEEKTPEKPPPEEGEKLNKIVESVGERIKNRRRKQIIYSSDSSPDKPLVVNDASLVIEKRNTRKSTKKIPKTKRKNALELLQEDLRDMFISDGVLTATGKRMCRMMKEHQEQELYNDLNEPKIKEKEYITSEDDDVPLAKRKNLKSPKKNLKLDLKQLETAKKDDKKEENRAEEIKRPQRRLRSSPRVLIEKIKFPAVKSSDEESSAEEKEEKKEEIPFVEPEIPVEVKRRGRPKGKIGAKRGRKKGKPLSAESSSVSLSTIDSETTETETVESEINESEINESETTEVETAETATENEEKSKKKLVKKKKNSWAHGVIKKEKRKMRKFDRSTSSLSQYTETSDQMSIDGSINEDISVNEDVSVNENEDIEAELPSRSQNSEDDEYALLNIDLKPDLNYFLDNSNRFNCKLCDYKGKFIVVHYRTRHPESEIMISRLNPDQAEKAQIESRLNKFDEIKPYEEIENGKKRRTTFVCRFCNFCLKKEVVGTFFDHVACHTGEYRYSCELCQFFASNKKILSAHCYNTHPELKKPLTLSPLWSGPANFRIMFGYLCKACNFTQLLKKNIENHIKISHFGQNIEIIKINMSSKPVPLDNLNTTELKTKVEVEESMEEIREKSPEPIKEKEADMTAFLEPDNISLREQLIEEERLKKMEEIASNITPRRSTFQFVDQLKNKIQSALKQQLDEQQRDDQQLPIEIKKPPIDESQTEEIFEEKEDMTPPEVFSLKICSTISLAESETQNPISEENENTSKEDTIRIASTCSLAELESSENEDSQKSSEETIELPDEEKEEETHVSEEDMDISNVKLSTPSDAKQKGVLDTIQRLAAKLQTPKVPENSDNSSEVAQFEQVEIKEEETQEEELNDFQEKVINVGAIEVRIKNKEQNYICKVPNCSFTSLYKISFTKHCADVHTKITVLCEICARENSFNCFTMTSLFVHLFDIHKSNAKIVTAPPSAKIRIRRISGDLLSKPTETDPLLEVGEPIAETSESNPEPSQQQEQEMGFLQIKDVRTLTEEEEHNLQPNPQKTPPKLTEIQKPSPTVKIIQPNLAVVRRSTNTTDAKKIIPTKKVMIPVQELSKFANIKHTYQKKPIATSSTENVIWYKTKKIFNEMLTFPKILDLYKCPIEFCSFSTGAQKEYKIHMISHKWCQISVCVYCREGISSNNLITHIDSFHSHCTLQCALCFYRTISKTYLIDHQKTVHKHDFKTLVKGFYYNITPTNKTSFLYEIPSRSLVISPYQCIQGNCTEKFLTADDFMVHLHVYHKKYFMCAICDDRTVYYVTAQTLIQHYIVHNIARLQCQYCVCGTLDMDAMFTHYATKHQHLEPICYVRQFKKSANTSSKTIDDFILINMDSRKTIEPAKIIPQTPEESKIEQTSSTITALPEDQNVSSNEEEPVETEEHAKIIDIVLENEPETSKIINVDLDKDVETAKIVNIDLDKDSKNSKIIDVIDLSEENLNFNEPYVILKHRNIESKNAVDNAVDPLLVNNCEKPNDTTEIEPEEVANLSDYELYKCGTKNCTFRTSSLNDFKSHLFICDVFCSSYNCVHCDTELGSVVGLCDHIQIHGKKRFICGVCDYKSSIGQQIVTHMKDLHKITTTKFHPIDPLKVDMARDHFMVESIDKDKEMKKEEEKEKSILKTKLEEESQNSLKLISVPTFTNLFGPESVQNQLEKRFTCEICKYQSCLGQDIVTHMKDLHQVHYTQFHPIDPQRKDLSRDHFYVKAILKKSLESKEDDNKIKNIFGPEDIDSLPRPPVYSSEIKCKLCNYNTKVRSNMQRHLQQHIDEKAVPETAPVNPVPCLEKNEKMFDKMTNLAASSHYVRMSGKAAAKSDKSKKEADKIYPGFIAVGKRFVCGAQNCNYLTHGDQMLRHHLTALHADEIIYKCPHCQIDIPADIDGLEIDQILFHLKMHDLHLYKCPNCQFIHYQKHKIEKHISDNHSDEENKNIVVIRELDNSANRDDDSRAAMPVSFREQITENVPIQQPWRCGICNFKCQSRSEILNHTHTQHGIKSQYKCGKCKFKCSAKNNYIRHFKKIHPDFDGPPEIETVYYKITEEEHELEQASSSSQDDASEISSPLPQNFDTTPLWTKNKTGIKHIRGILLEETKSSSPKRTPKIIEKLQEIKSNLGEGTSKSVDDITKNLFTAESKEEKYITPEKNEETDVETITEEIIPSTSKLHCKSCDFVAKNIRTFRTHQRKHYSHYPYKCNYCDFKTITVQSISHHHRAKHKTEQMSYTEIPAPKTDEIAPESLKRKRSLVDENIDENPAKILVKNEEGTDIITMEEAEIEATIINDENKQIFYSCLHCPRKSAELGKIRLHFFETHTGKSSGFKYKKVIMDKTKKLHYKCNYCDWFGDPNYLKQHCFKQHNDQTWVPQRNTKLKCSFCSQICAKIPQIRKHFIVKHPNENLTFYTLLEDGTILDKTEFFEEKQLLLKCNYCSDHFENKTELQNHHTLLHSHLQFEEETSYVLNDKEEFKKFKCPECGHTSNSHPAMKMHLRGHNPPFLCSHCSEYFFFPSHLKNHHVKLHGDLPLVINEAPEVKKQLDKLTENLLYLNDEGTYTTKNKLKRPNNSDLDEPPNKILLLDDELDTNVKRNVAKKSTSLPAFPKNVAKKSTANRPKSLEYSFYGTKPCDINNYKNVMSQINIMGKVMPINVVAMSHVLNLFPTVQVVDVINQKKL